jgi:carboxyl-terminal processing protease
LGNKLGESRLVNGNRYRLMISLRKRLLRYEPTLPVLRMIDVLTLGSLAALGAWPAYSQPAVQPDASQGEAHRTTFDEVWETVRDRFYDRDLHGLDWPAVRRRYQPLADSAYSREQLAAVINAMLAELGSSHTQLYTLEDTAYYQLADIFIDSLRRRGLDRIFPSGEVTYSGSGAFTNEDDQRRTVVTGVVEDTPAHQAGLLIGDEILAADDLPFRPVASFQDKVGVPVALSVRCDPGGPPMALSVTPAAIHPNAIFLRGLQTSARVIAAANGVRVGMSMSGPMLAASISVPSKIRSGMARCGTPMRWSGTCATGGAGPSRSISTSSTRMHRRCR